MAYSGREVIHFSSAENSIRLDSVDLSISSVKISGRNQTFKIMPDEQVIVVDTDVRSPFDLEISFSGNIPKLLTGLYLAKSRTGNIFTTQLESTGARRMFPCIDNPSFKAVFSIEVEIDSDLDAISNMPVEKAEINEKRKKIKFLQTPVMSTYLLYLGVGRFSTRSIKRKDTEIIIAAPEGELTKSDFPLEIAAKALDAFEDYFGIDYVLPKVHLISVPEFSAGAMENWGAITFREVYLSIDDSTSSSSYKLTGEVIAHELAHQWFGNLVTMEWWNDLWLNESFATFMSYKVLAEIHPEWDTLADMVHLRTEGALKNDALKNSHPIDADVKSPDEIAQIFDEISYGKGASILRMIEGYVGEENFRKGIRKYLQDHKYGNARGSDLWSSIEQVSGLPVSRIMEAWIKKTGYPAISAARKNGQLELTQEQFLIAGGKSDETWPIPLTYVENGQVKSALFENKQMTIQTSDSVRFNNNFSGFYRTVYDREIFEKIVSGIGSLSGLDVWGLANDAYSLMLAGKLSKQDYTERIKKIWQHENPMVINEITGQLRSLYLISPGNKELAGMVGEFCSMHLNRLGEKKKGEPINASVARGSLKALNSIVNDEFAIAMAKKFDEYFSVDPDERDAVTLSYARTGGKFSKLLSALEKATTDEDRTRILAAMAWVSSEEELSRALDLIRTAKVKKQDTMRFYISAASSPGARDFMFNNMDFAIRQLREVYVGSRIPSRVIESIVPLLGITRENEMKQALLNYGTQDLTTGIRKAIELLGVNVKVNRLFREKGSRSPGTP